MGKLTKVVAALTVGALVIFPLWLAQAYAQENASPLTINTGESRVHILRAPARAKALMPLLADPGPLVYNGGPIMPKAKTYAIFWLPSKLQDGTSTFMSSSYRSLIRRFLTDYPGHGIDNNNTQYYQLTPTIKFIHNAGAFAGAFLDTSPYPASGCSDAVTPGNCLSDKQIRNEIKKIIALEGWPVGLTNMFMLFTSLGEGSCLTDISGTYCAYTDYCGYHGHVGTTAGTAIIYANIPYADPNYCQSNSVPSPNSDADADDATTIVSHELTEAITDPLLNAWYTAQGNEIGDLCAYDYGTLGWDGGTANQMWNGNFYLVQREFDNFASACVQVGP